jgi:hypothetical protein
MWRKRELPTLFWLGNVKERGHLHDLGVGGDNIKMDLKDVG